MQLVAEFEGCARFSSRMAMVPWVALLAAVYSFRKGSEQPGLESWLEPGTGIVVTAIPISRHLGGTKRLLTLHNRNMWLPVSCPGGS